MIDRQKVIYYGGILGGLALVAAAAIFVGLKIAVSNYNSVPTYTLKTFAPPTTISAIGPTETPWPTYPTFTSTNTPDITATFTPSETLFSPPEIPTTAASATPTPTPSPHIIIGNVGDFGAGNDIEQKIIDVLKDYGAQAITTNGDNCYVAFTICPDNLDRWDFWQNDSFFPAFGNHDREYGFYGYFNLPTHYDEAIGFARFYFLNAYTGDFSPESEQGKWLEERINESKEPWNIVILHPAPYSSGAVHGSYEPAQWPFAEMGVDVVIAGHEHNYERIERDGILYFVNGAGGGPLYDFGEPIEGSQKQIKEHGVMMIYPEENNISFTFVNTEGIVLDNSSIGGGHGKGGPTITPDFTETFTPTLEPTEETTSYMYLPLVNNNY